MTTLADKVYDVLTDDQHELSEFTEGSHSEAALDLCDQGFLYGLAYALAGAADAPDDENKREAWYAAEDVWRRWDSKPTRRDVDRAALRHE
ncbi:MAG: hypothetical protein AABM42_10040 [Actinomycetota bacterium]